MGNQEIPPPLRIREEDGDPNAIPVFDVIVSNGTLTKVAPGVVRLATGGGGGASAASMGGVITGGSTPAVVFISDGRLWQDPLNFGYLDSQNHVVVGTAGSLGGKVSIKFVTTANLESGLTIQPQTLATSSNWITLKDTSGNQQVQFRISRGLGMGNPQLLIGTDGGPVIDTLNLIGLPAFGFQGNTALIFLGDNQGTAGAYYSLNLNPTGVTDGQSVTNFLGGGIDSAGALFTFTLFDAVASGNIAAEQNFRHRLYRVGGVAWTISPTGLLANGDYFGTPPGRIFVENPGEAVPNLILRADGGGSADLQRWQTTDALNQLVVNPSGDLTFASGTNTAQNVLILSTLTNTVGGFSYQSGFWRGIGGTSDTRLAFVGTTTSDSVFSISTVGDSNNRVEIFYNGSIIFGNGNANTISVRIDSNTQLNVNAPIRGSRLYSGNDGLGGANGDLICGNAASSRLFYDQSVANMVIANSSTQTQINLHANGETVFNEQGRLNCDFRVESDHQSNFFLIKADSDVLAIATASPDTSCRVFVNGIIGASAGSSGLTQKHGGRLIVNTTSANNAGAGADDLIVYALSANTLSVNGESLEIEAWGNFGATANAKQVILYLGSTQIFDTTSQIQNGGSWHLESTIVRIAATSSQCITRFSSPSVTLFTNEVNYVQATDNLAALNVIKCTGTATSDNDISQKGLIINHYPVA